MSKKSIHVASPPDKGARTKPAGSSTAKICLPELKKAIASLHPAEQIAIRQWMDSKRQAKRPKSKSPARWPDFQARQKAIFGIRILRDSHAVLDEVRADRF